MVKYDGCKLLVVTTLRCVRDVSSLAVASSDTLYVCDKNSQTVCLVDVTMDRVTQRLQKPRGASPDLTPSHVAFLGETLLVYHNSTVTNYYSHGASSTTTTNISKPLVTYRHGATTPVKVIPWSQNIYMAQALTTDNHSSFLMIGHYPPSVYVLNINGDLTHTIPIVSDSEPVDCAVVGKKLWVGCSNREIIVISSL